MSAIADRGGEQRFTMALTFIQTDSPLPPSVPCRGHLPLKGGEELEPDWQSGKTSLRQEEG